MTVSARRSLVQKCESPREQRYLFAVSAIGFAVNSLADLVMFEFIGAIGIPTATIATRLVMAAMFTLLIWHIIRARARKASNNNRCDYPYQ